MAAVVIDEDCVEEAIASCLAECITKESLENVLGFDISFPIERMT